MRAPVTRFADPVALGRALASRVADGIEAAAQAGRRYLLGCPGGRSAQTTYTALADEVRERELDVSRLVIVMMDEYVVPGARPGTFEAVADDLPHSCRGFGRDQIAGPLGVGLDQLWLPDPADPAAYDQRIAAAGGIDLFVLASGASDGHVAFNPPGAPADSTTRVVELPESTRRDNLVTFPTFDGLASVPAHGVTVGIGTIGALSRQAILVLHGADKATATARITATERYDPSWPASVVHACEQPQIFADEAAVSGLQRQL